MTTQPVHTDQRPTSEPTAPDATPFTGAYAAVWETLIQQPGATAAALAETAGIGRSTAAKALAAMEQDGHVRREPGTPDGNRRVASHWYPNQPTPPDPNSPTIEKEAASSTPHTAEQDVPARREPLTTTAVNQNTSPEGHTRPTSPTTDDTEAPGADDATTDSRPHQGTEAAPHEPAPPKLTVITGGAKQRLAPGGLRQLVLNHLQAHPDTAFTATALSRVIGKSSGAIANALVTLEKHGQAQQINDHPRRYQLRTDIEQ